VKRIINLIMAMCLLGLAACAKVESGHVGVKVNLYGDDRGVSQEVLGPGRYLVGWNTQIFEYPTYTYTDKWTKDPHEGSPVNQEIAFQAAGGITVSTDLAIAFHINATDVPKVFQKYRRGVDEISDTFLRNMVRDEMNRLGIGYDAESLLGSGKQKLLADVTKAVQARAEEIGIQVESLSYLSELRFPPQVTASINAKIQATQDAMTVENEVRKTKAEAEKQVVKADAQVRVAQAEAQAIEERGKAYRDNPQVLQLEIAKLNAEALRETKVQILGTMPTLFRDVSKQ
jgi:regulator of protease activity HflC (stomatin/prohibitin superfamily)